MDFKKTLDGMDTKTISIATLISAAFVVIPAWIWFDDRYAHTDDLKQIKQDEEEHFFKFRHSYLNDKIFELDLKTNPTKEDKALRDRYQNEMDELEAQHGDKK